jgi:serine/threonine protein kinase
MPLHDAFKKKTGQSAPKQSEASERRIQVQPKLIKMSSVPGIEDLRYSMTQAQQQMGQPVMLTWRRGDRPPTFLLTVTSSPDIMDPTWILHIGDEENTAIAWIYKTIDPDLIYSLLVEAVSEQGPAAVIPESLRPGANTNADALAAPAPSQELEVPRAHEPGSNFSEDYEIVDLIGTGGMGMIYKARHRGSGQIVALKVLHTHLLTDPRSAKRFEQEANSAKRLHHRNLISVHEYGFSKFKQPFLVMDYLEGLPLASVIENSGPLDLQSFINIFTQICDGLTHAHEKGVIHRDLKPSNVMIFKTDSGVDTIKIIDFGIAKMARAESGEHLTTTGDVLGSPGYMSPEQCGGTQLDARSDIYSLGCMMYEAIAGVLPFEHPNAIKTILMQISDNPPPINGVRPDLQVPEELERIIFKSLEKDPDLRYQTAEELGGELWAMTITHASTPVLKPGHHDLFSVLRKEDAEGGEAIPAGEAPVSTATAQPAAPLVEEEPDVPTVPFKFEAFESSNEPVYDLLKVSGLFTDADFEVAARCLDLIEQGRISQAQAAIAIQMCHRTGTSFEEMAKQLGIKID